MESLIYQMPYSETEIRKAAVFVLVACAMSDGIPDEKEILAIRQRMILHFHGRGVGIDAIIDDVIAKFVNTSSHELWDKIEQNVIKICPREADKDLLLSDLEFIIEADGYVSETESLLFRQIKNILHCS
jgi:uncharacterized tellurite resistance protein B-like protein